MDRVNDEKQSTICETSETHQINEIIKYLLHLLPTDDQDALILKSAWFGCFRDVITDYNLQKTDNWQK